MFAETEENNNNLMCVGVCVYIYIYILYSCTCSFLVAPKSTCPGDFQSLTGKDGFEALTGGPWSLSALLSREGRRDFLGYQDNSPHL